MRIRVGQIEVSASPFSEASSTFGLSGLGGTWYYQVSISSLQFVQNPAPPFDPSKRIVGAIDMDGNFIPYVDPATDPEKLLIDAHISSARVVTGTGSQFLDYGPGDSAGVIGNVSSMVFRLQVKTRTQRAVRARATIVAYSED